MDLRSTAHEWLVFNHPVTIMVLNDAGGIPPYTVLKSLNRTPGWVSGQMDFDSKEPANTNLNLLIDRRFAQFAAYNKVTFMNRFRRLPLSLLMSCKILGGCFIP